MKHFYIGCRVSDIVTITKSYDEKYPTKIIFRHGGSVNVSPTWDVAQREIEKILNAQDEETQRLHEERAQISADCERIRNEILTLQDIHHRIKQTAPPMEPDRKLLTDWFEESRPYLRADEKEALARILWGDKGK